MNTVFNFSYNGDTYEVFVEGFILSRITCYPGGTGRRQDMSYDDLPKQAKEIIIQRIETHLRRMD